jgi:hypothetical protein
MRQGDLLLIRKEQASSSGAFGRPQYRQRPGAGGFGRIANRFMTVSRQDYLPPALRSAYKSRILTV